MKILILSNFGMGLYKFRIELLEELINRKFDVYVSLPNDEYVPKLEAIGCKVIDTHLDRRGANPIKDLKLILFYIKTIKHIKPDVVLTYTIKPNIYGGIACQLTKTPYIANITGLGTAIEKQGLMRRITITLYRIGLRKASCVFFQNKPNRQLFLDENIIWNKARNRTRLIPGSGVNLEYHKFEQYPDDGQVRFLFIGRIMKAKGIFELLEAAKRVSQRYSNVQFDLIGPCEEDFTKELTELNEHNVIKYHGLQHDVHSYIKNAHATILPSYHEGTANVLLESAATGRPVLASNVTGCIETFDEGISGLSFEVKSVDSLVDAITKFIHLPYAEKKRMGYAGRIKMEKEFDRRLVVNAYIEEINQVITQ